MSSMPKTSHVRNTLSILERNKNYKINEKTFFTLQLRGEKRWTNSKEDEK